MDTTGHDHDADSSPGHTSKIRPLIEGVRTYHGDVNDEDTEDDSMSSTSLLGGGEAESRRRSRRWPFQARWSIPQDDFYVRVVDAFNGWRKTRRKSWRTFGRFAYTLLKAVIFSSWAIKVRIIGLYFAHCVSALRGARSRPIWNAKPNRVLVFIRECADPSTLLTVAAGLPHYLIRAHSRIHYSYLSSLTSRTLPMATALRSTTTISDGTVYRSGTGRDPRGRHVRGNRSSRTAPHGYSQELGQPLGK